MSPDFSFTREEDGDRTVIALIGDINERTDLGEIFRGLESTRITVSLKGVTRINSCGVRDWVNTLKPLQGNFQIKIEYVECSRAIVDQLNMIVNFLNSGNMVSFYAPYYCDQCDEEHEKLIVIAEHFPGEENLEEPEAPDFECPICGKTMEFNEDEEKYFSFLME